MFPAVAAPAPSPPLLSRRRHRRRLWWIVVVAALVGAAAAVALIETDAAKATAVSVQDNRPAGPGVYPPPATRPQRLGLDPASYATHVHQRRVP
jgi:putative exporter of polyketide antibiotics